MAHESNFGKGFLIGMLTGGAIGAIIALLYAPKSGRELRQDIRNKTDEYLDDAEKYLAEAKDKAKDLINEGKKKSEKIISEAKIKSEELLKDAEKLFSDAKNKAGQIISSGKENIHTETDRIKNAVKAGMDAYKDAKES
jgi:gas vesicle protein